MPNFTLSEILTIMLVILVVFGPERLPEMARKAGELVRKGRSMVTDLKRDFEGEWEEVAQPLKAVREEMQGVKTDLQSSMNSLSDEVQKAKEEMEAEVKDAKQEIESQLGDVEKRLDETVNQKPDEPAADDDEKGSKSA